MNIYTWIITFLIVYTPHVVAHLVKKHWLKQSPSFSLRPSPILIWAGLLYPIARAMPEPITVDNSVTLLQHFIGGGFISALYFIYIEKEFSLNLPWYMKGIFLYATVSSLGAANEILEFSATQLGIYPLHGGDVWWDLASNTLGAYTLYILVSLCQNLITRKNQKRH
jgi:hypothetical protein